MFEDRLLYVPLDRPRVTGSFDRALAFFAASIPLVAVGIGVSLAALHFKGLVLFEGLATLGAVSVVAAGLAVMFGVKELRRPIRIGSDGRAQCAAIRGAPLRWHPAHPEILEEFRRGTILPGPRRGRGIYASDGRVNTVVSFEGAPFRVGGVARIRVGIAADAAARHPTQVEFRLRCLRESRGRPFALLPPLACLASLEPQRVTGPAWRLDFTIPAGLPGSDLLAREPTYWQLEVDADGMCAPYIQRFFVPVVA